MHAFILRQFGFSWKDAFTDSAVANVLLGGTALLVSLSLQHYIPQKNRYGYLFSVVMIFTVMWLTLNRFISLRIIDVEAYRALWQHSIFIRGAFGLLIIVTMALVSALWYSMEDQRELDRRREEADQLSRTAELNTLRQQLQPHFLFNSLNSINALIQVQPENARKMVQQLSDFLRGTLRDQQQWVSIDDELDHLQLYLQIEKVRFGHRLSAEVVNAAPGTQLPAMLLQPLVENAIKFGLYNTVGEVTIRVEARVEDSMLRVQVSNPFDADGATPGNGAGFGLKSVQRRLHLLFGRNDLLTTEIQDHHFIATVNIPQP